MRSFICRGLLWWSECDRFVGQQLVPLLMESRWRWKGQAQVRMVRWWTDLICYTCNHPAPHGWRRSIVLWSSVTPVSKFCVALRCRFTFFCICQHFCYLLPFCGPRWRHRLCIREEWPLNLFDAVPSPAGIPHCLPLEYDVQRYHQAQYWFTLLLGFDVGCSQNLQSV